MKTSVNIIIMTLFLLGLNTGCKKLIEVDPPDDWLESEMVFSNDAQATAAVMGLYSSIMGQTKYFLNGGMSLFPGLSSDELVRTFSLSNEDQFFNNALLPANPVVHNAIWRAGYMHLYQCNSIIEGLHNSTSVNPVVRDRLSGEAKFVRALCYYYLINLYGDVPLALSSKADENSILRRSRTDVVCSQIVNDLQDASKGLLDTPENTRPNKMACEALLARVYLYKRDWSNAEKAATAVINSTNYQLVANLNQVFLADSRETIFQWAPVLSHNNSGEGYIFIPFAPNTRPSYVITKELQAGFEAGDNRKMNWLYTIELAGAFYTYPYKYRVYSSDTVTEYNIVLRLAEQYLIRAEARTQQENVGAAVDDINLIRIRAGLTEIASNVSKTECLAALEQERRIELFAEWGHRWIDLKRWGKADSVLGVVKVNNWQPSDQLYPIPASEIEKNPNLTQNAGYIK